MEIRYAWDEFVSYGQKRDLRKNAILYRQGESGNGFYYLYKGEARIQLLSDQGDERIIDYIHAGELMGEQGVKSAPYFTTAIITVPSTLYYFSNEAFQQLCKMHPHATNIFLHSLLNKVRLLADIVSVLHSPVEYQMAHFLYKLHHKQQSNEININQTSLARYIGTSRVTVYKILQIWKKEGMIDISNRSIFICDIEKIENLLKKDQPMN